MYKEKDSILNICGGKILPDINKELDSYFLLNVDQNYFSDDKILDIRSEHFDFIDNIGKEYNYVSYINHDIYDFLERYDIPFNKIIIYRFLEHVPKSKVLYFIYLLSTLTKLGAVLDVIVPDYKKLAKRILKENPYDSNFEAEDIITTYELLNDQTNPHLSLWTKERLYYFFELESRFKVKSVKENYKFDGRDIYLRATVERI